MPTIHADISLVPSAVAPTTRAHRRLSRGAGLAMAAVLSATVWVGILALVSRVL